MAIVKEIVCENGARAMIADDCYRGITPEEYARRRARIWEVMCRVDRNAQYEAMSDEERKALEARALALSGG